MTIAATSTPKAIVLAIPLNSSSILPLSHCASSNHVIASDDCECQSYPLRLADFAYDESEDDYDSGAHPVQLEEVELSHVASVRRPSISLRARRNFSEWPQRKGSDACCSARRYCGDDVFRQNLQHPSIPIATAIVSAAHCDDQVELG